MLKQILCIVFLVISSINYGQAWEFVYDSIPTLGRQIIITNDSNYLVNGVDNGFEDNNLSIKLDVDGNVIWMSPNGGYAVTQTHDNKYVFAGSHSPYGVIKKVDEKGDKEWDRHYGDGSQEIYRAVIESTDGSFVVCGSSHNHGDSTFFAMKTDSDGDVLWTRSFYSMYNCGFIAVTPEGGFIVSGCDPYPYYANLLAELDSMGNWIWQKEYPTIYTATGDHLHPLNALKMADLLHAASVHMPIKVRPG